jgi:hypothetical protein
MAATNVFNLTAARVARDVGMGTVAANNPVFSKQYREYIDDLPQKWIGSDEDVRRNWRGVQPKHPNAWGANWGAAVRRGQLVKLPQEIQMQKISSHARRTHLYEKVWTW